MQDLPAKPAKDQPWRPARSARVALALIYALSLPLAAAQSKAAREEEDAVFALESPAVRAMLERASVAEAGSEGGSGVELAAKLYCRAANFGSVEAAYRLARMILAGRGMPRDLPMAATLFGIAAANGHPAAAEAISSLGEREERLPKCLVEPPR